jgi:uncharacterized membrane protein
MISGKVDALHVGAVALAALALLHIVWHVWLLPPANSRIAATLAVSVIPLLPGLWICLRNLRRGVLVGGIACLFYFCHGVSVAYADPAARLPALAEIALTLIVVGALGWDARKYKRKKSK